MGSSESVDALIRPTVLSSEVTDRHLSKIAFVHCAANVGLWRRFCGVWVSRAFGFDFWPNPASLWEMVGEYNGWVVA